MPDRRKQLRWRTADGRTGTVGAGSRRAGAGPRRVQAASTPPPESAARRAFRQRYGLGPDASDNDLFAVANAAMATRPPRAPAASTPPPRAPLVSAAGPTEAELLEEAEWEATNARLFGLPADGPATRALAAAHLPTLADRRRDQRIAAEVAREQAFARAAEADRMAQVHTIDGLRAGTIAAGQADRDKRQEALERQHGYDRSLWPELR